jgi:hypothetical protein
MNLANYEIFSTILNNSHDKFVINLLKYFPVYNTTYPNTSTREDNGMSDGLELFPFRYVFSKYSQHAAYVLSTFLIKNHIF